MMASSKTRLIKKEPLSDRDFEGVIAEGEETNELEDLDEYAKKRGLVRRLI